MGFRFEKLQVWHEARAFIKEIYLITKKFPPDEKFGLSDQIRRAAVSILLNITEGSDRKSDVEFRRFLRISITSTEEVVAALYVSLDLEYIEKQDFDKLYANAEMIVAKLNALVNKISSSSR